MTVAIIINSSLFYENSAEYYYQMNVLSNIVFFFYFRIESIIEAAVPWYHLTVKNRSFFFYLHFSFLISFISFLIAISEEKNVWILHIRFVECIHVEWIILLSITSRRHRKETKSSDWDVIAHLINFQILIFLTNELHGCRY